MLRQSIYPYYTVFTMIAAVVPAAFEGLHVDMYVICNYTMYPSSMKPYAGEGL